MPRRRRSRNLDRFPFRIERAKRPANGRALFRARRDICRSLRSAASVRLLSAAPPAAFSACRGLAAASVRQLCPLCFCSRPRSQVSAAACRSPSCSFYPPAAGRFPVAHSKSPSSYAAAYGRHVFTGPVCRRKGCPRLSARTRAKTGARMLSARRSGLSLKLTWGPSAARCRTAPDSSWPRSRSAPAARSGWAGPSVR